MQTDYQRLNIMKNPLHWSSTDCHRVVKVFLLKKLTLVSSIFTTFPLACNRSMSFSLQWTVVGVTGKNGVPVQSHVVAEFKEEYGAAATLRLLMEEKTVLGKGNRHKSAMKMPVQVIHQKLLYFTKSI